MPSRSQNATEPVVSAFINDGNIPNCYKSVLQTVFVFFSSLGVYRGVRILDEC